MYNHSFKTLLEQFDETGCGESRERWVRAAKRFFSRDKVAEIIPDLGESFCLVFHGSSMHNVEDVASDLDFWLLMSKEALTRFDRAVPHRFIDIEIEGKAGHINPLLVEDVARAFREPQFELIYELRCGEGVYGGTEVFDGFKARARLPMGDPLRRAAFMHNYVEMRAWHRSADNPMERHDAWTALANVVKTVEYALRCALILDGRPFPYGKWLHVAAHQCPTGRMITPHVDAILSLLGTGAESLLGPEKGNPISAELREIRGVLVERARQEGFEAAWLQTWWLHIDEARTAMHSVTWPGRD